VAADLEREMLLGDRHGGNYWKHQIAAAERTQRGAMPTLAPLLDGWQTAGWAAQADRLGGGFFDWFCLPKGILAVALGDTVERGLEGALAAGGIKATARAHAQYHHKPEQLLAQASLAMWTTSAGDQSANLFFGFVETAGGAVHFASAGHVNVVAIRPDGWQSLSQPSAPLGGSPETQYEPQHYDLQPGESLMVFSDGFRDALDAQGRPLGEAGLAEKLVPYAAAPADQIVRIARECLQAHAVAPDKMDRAILVVRRTPS
jgi:phosphoserine phosphatase RsbU/P